jgi:hypothetical protein
VGPAKCEVTLKYCGSINQETVTLVREALDLRGGPAVRRYLTQVQLSERKGVGAYQEIHCRKDRQHQYGSLAGEIVPMLSIRLKNWRVLYD